MSEQSIPVIKYVALVHKPLAVTTINVPNAAMVLDLNHREFLGIPKASALLPVYDTLEEIREEFPKAPVFEVVLPVDFEPSKILRFPPFGMPPVGAEGD
jgi:hypothetical protein